jgi:TfoX/Sxy family transcriptional regulator of competence genes
MPILNFMATEKDTVEFLLQRLRPATRFSVRPMFGEFALYADGKVVGLICDNLFYVKIVPASVELESLCEKGEPYLGARPHYIVEEGQLITLPNLSAILFGIAASVPEKKARKKKAVRKSSKRSNPFRAGC